jgi:hypothetical protein
LVWPDWSGKCSGLKAPDEQKRAPQRAWAGTVHLKTAPNKEDRHVPSIAAGSVEDIGRYQKAIFQVSLTFGKPKQLQIRVLVLDGQSIRVGIFVRLNRYSGFRDP